MNKELKQLIDLDTMILNTSTDELYKNSDVNFLIGWQSGALGSFDDYLINAMFSADGSNIIKLYKGFPERMLAVRSYQIKKGFWQLAQQRYLND